MAIGAVATPARALIDTFDLGINILGNFTGAIFSIVSMQRLWAGSTDAVTVAQVRQIGFTNAATTAIVTNTLATRAVAQAKLFWSGVIVAIGGTATVMTARIWLMTAAMHASAIATRIAGVAKGLYNTVLIAVNGTAAVMAVRLWLTSAAITATGVASKVATVGLTAMGSALLFIQALPIIAIISGFVLALVKLHDAWKQWERARDSGKGFWSHLHNTGDYDNWARQAAEYVGLVDSVTNAEMRLRQERGRTASGGILVGGRKKGGVGPAGPTPVISPDALARPSEVWKKEQGILGLTDTDTPSFIKPASTKAADDYAKKLTDVNKKIRELQEGTSVLNDANKSAIESYTKLGLSAEDIAIKLKKPTIAVSAYLTELKKLDDAKQTAMANAERYAAFENQLRQQELRNTNRALEAQLAADRKREESQRALQGVAADYAQRNKERSLHGTALELERIRVTRDREIRALGERTVANAAYWDKAWNELQIYFAGEEAALKKSLTNWEKTYIALDSVSRALDNIGGKAAALGSELARDAQSIMNAYKAGGGGLTGLINAAVEGVIIGIKWIGKLVGAVREGRNAVKEFAASFDTLAKGSGFDELNAKLVAAGREDLWIDLTQRVAAGSKKQADAAIAEIRSFLEKLDADIQKYGLAWTDLADTQGAANRAGKDLVETYGRLTRAGYTADAVLRQMGGDINQFIIHSITAGVKIPAAFEPIIKKLIETGRLTDEAARAMLGLHKDAMPSLADIKSAADRYGLSLDQLGPKVKQLQITNEANQIVKDFDMLVKAGVPIETLMTATSEAFKTATDKVVELNKKGYDTAAIGTDAWKEYQEAVKAVDAAATGMGQRVQKLVLESITAGMELPAAMKPMIEKLIEGGYLTDEFGDKLTDTSKLTFAADLAGMFEALILKLDELIDKIGTGVGGALDNIGRRVVSPTIRPIYDRSGIPSDAGGDTVTPDSMAGGGVVYASRGAVIPFIPRGTDTVPAMLTPGERVLTVSENRAYEARGGEQTIVIELDRRTIAKATTKGMPEYIRVRTGR